MGQVACCTSSADKPLAIESAALESVDSVYVALKTGRILDILHLVLKENGSGKLSSMSVFGNADVIWDGKVFQKCGGAYIWTRQGNGEFHSDGFAKLVEISKYWRQVEGEGALSVAPTELQASRAALGDSSKPYPLYDALANGSFRLVRGQILEDLWERRQPWPMQQELPKHALWDAEEACSLRDARCGTGGPRAC
eukprot:TRINITY_DN25532_c0_g1_i2.p1 TRINITY_DN25532_c0_g1~~TRINITY_DN25532_c0_g1_i2.p1  ORF type:complete len:196 (-),score=16.06 TRINITY_DN25532_c0_g1_i2:20-607(-)